MNLLLIGWLVIGSLTSVGISHDINDAKHTKQLFEQIDHIYIKYEVKVK